jgi:iron(III) transport system substrate-binding protein
MNKILFIEKIVNSAKFIWETGFVFIILLAVLLFGCGRSNDGITVYTALEPEQVEKYLALFNETHPNVRVNIVRESTGIITARLLAEGVNTTADLVWGTAVTSLLVLDELGMLEPYAPTGLERIHPQFRDDANPPTWVGLNAWELAIVVNTVLAEQMGLPEIRSYQDLLRPEFRGQIVMSNPSSSGTGFLAISGLIQAWGEEAAFRYLDALHENIAQYIHSGSRPARMAGAGEFAVGISFGYAAVNVLNRGYPVRIIFPEE